MFCVLTSNNQCKGWWEDTCTLALGGGISGSHQLLPATCLISWARGDRGLPVSLERGTSVAPALPPSVPPWGGKGGRARACQLPATQGHPLQVLSVRGSSSKSRYALRRCRAGHSPPACWP
jgi:hypothetical protein